MGVHSLPCCGAQGWQNPVQSQTGSLFKDWHGNSPTGLLSHSTTKMTDESDLENVHTAGGLLQSLPYDVVLRAKLMVSHLLLPKGSIVLDMECGTGTLTAAMA